MHYVIGQKLKSPSVRTESELVESFLERGFPPTLGKSMPHFIFEPKLLTGFPDIVAVYPTKVEIEKKYKQPSFSSRHFQILHHIYVSDKVSLNSIGTDLLLRPKDVMRCVGDLEESGYVRMNQNNVKLNAISKIFFARRIIAIEAKIANWKRALKQALANQWFASESYILIPENRNIDKVIADASANGIGVITFNGVKSRVFLRASQQEIPISIGSWLINDFIIRNIFEK